MSVVQRLVYVSGAPGSGKSTLAAPLAAELGYALLGKDIIKETLHGVLGPPELDRAKSRELGAASMELLWALAARSPQVLIEANFRPYSSYERDRITGLGGVQVEVHCVCLPELAVARYHARPGRRGHLHHAEGRLPARAAVPEPGGDAVDPRRPPAGVRPHRRRRPGALVMTKQPAGAQ